MASFNKIILLGYLGRDPETKYLPDGTAICSFSIATTEKRKDKSGEMQDQTTWFRVTAWKRLAEVAQQYLAKGSQVYVEGRLRQESYTDKDGHPRTSLEVTATELQFIGKRDEQAHADPQTAPVNVRAATVQKAASVRYDDPQGPDDNQIPF